MGIESEQLVVFKTVGQLVKVRGWFARSVLHRNRNVQCCHKEFTLAGEPKDRVRSNWPVAPGAMTSRVWLWGSGTWRLCNKGLGGSGCLLAWRSDCRPKDQPHGLVETVGAGARKSGCQICCGGESAVMGSSDSMQIPAVRVCLPVVMLIASAVHLEESEKGVPALHQISSSENKASAATNATPISTATTNSRTSTRS